MSEDNYGHGKYYRGEDTGFQDIEMVDPVQEYGECEIYQLYIRGMNVGCVHYDIMDGTWETVYAPEGMVGGHSNVSAKSAKKLMKAIAKQFHIA